MDENVDGLQPYWFGNAGTLHDSMPDCSLFQNNLASNEESLKFMLFNVDYSIIYKYGQSRK